MNEIISNITSNPYEQLGAIIPCDVDKDAVKNIFENLIEETISHFTPVKSPYLVNVSGIPGSGKSTYCQKILNEGDDSNLLYLSFDKIMENESLPYSLEEKENAEMAFERWELPARVAGYELLRRAVKEKINILFEHSSSIKEHLNLFRFLIEEDYQVHFIYLAIDVDKAKKRISKRKRYVPKDFIECRMKAIEELLPKYEKLCTSYKEVKE